MIRQTELQKLANDYGVPGYTIDRDWVIGHILKAMFQRDTLFSGFVFKGGTCLRKCWFPGYRYSEDLDFTVINPDLKIQLEDLRSLAKLVYENTFDEWFNRGVLIDDISMESVNYKDLPMGYSVQFSFYGAHHNSNQAVPPVSRWLTKISMDISSAELLALTPVKRDLIHRFSDFFSEPVQIPCYPIEEILSEKLRALVERKYTSPRDYYDLWYISNSLNEIDWALVGEVFKRKCIYKGIVIPESSQVITSERKMILEKHWKKNLEYLMPASMVPDLYLVIHDVQDLLNGLSLHP